MKRNILRSALCLLLAAVLLFPLAGCRKKSDGRGICIAYTDAEISEEFTKTFDPLYASNDKEYALGTLIAPTVMRYDEQRGWLPVLGTIELSEEDGVTVAYIRFEKDLRFNQPNRQKVTVENYKKVMEKILRSNYYGYFNDYYKYPIEGVLAFKFGNSALTLDQIPDFDGELDRLFASLDAAEYRQMLLDTDIAGLYGPQASPETRCPDGRPFRQLLMEESDREELRDESFYISVSRRRMLELLSEFYSRKSRDEWMIKPLRRLKYLELMKQTAENNRNIDGTVSSITGLTLVKTGPDPYCKVRFTQKMEDRSEAIRMLNLPIVSALTLDAEIAAIGAGAFTPGGVTESSGGRVIRLDSEDGSLNVTEIGRAYVAATVGMKQLTAAVLSSPPTEKERADFDRNGLKVYQTGSSYVVYDPAAISEEKLNEYSLLFA